MSRKSTKSEAVSKSGRPDKPYEGFPLFAHRSGQWARKYQGRFYYFGSWRTDADGTEALKRYNREWPYLKEGRTPPPVDTGDGLTLRHLCNVFLTSKRNKLDSGELSGHTFTGYHKSCERMLDYFGKDRRVDDLRPDDFEGFRKSLAGMLGVVALKNEINRCRIVLKYAFDQRLIDRPVAYGQSFDKPSARMIRKARNEAGPKLFEADELRRILKEAEADPVLRAMTLLAINGGLGNTDVANLPRTAIDFESGWLNYPRPKTEIHRRIPLWPETIKALQVAIEMRPTAKDPADADIAFLTVQGNRYVRCVPSKTTPDKFITRNTVANRFGALLKRLKINGRRGLGFYTCRHNFETVAGESRDQVAVDSIMGHVDSSMAATYRESISDERLRAVVDVVRTWLFPEADEAGDEQPAVVKFPAVG